MVKFLLYGNTVEFNRNMIEFGLIITKNTDYTANIDTRFEFLRFVEKQLSKYAGLVIINYDTLNNMIASYANSLIIIHNEVNNAHISISYKFRTKSEIYNMIDNMYISKQNKYFLINRRCIRACSGRFISC
jgi:hypothetical protein